MSDEKADEGKIAEPSTVNWVYEQEEDKSEKGPDASSTVSAAKGFDGYDDTGSAPLLLDPWADLAASQGGPGQVISKRARVAQAFGARGFRQKVFAFVGIVMAVSVVAVGGGVTLAKMMGDARQQASPVLIASHLGTATIKRPSLTPTLHPNASPTSSPPSAPATVVSHAPSAAPSAGKSVLLQDNFQRADLLSGWGVASLAGGQAWRILSGDPAAFSVVTNTGQIASINELGSGYYTATLGSVAAGSDQDVSITFTMWGFGSQANMGVLAGWQDQGSYYKAYVDGANLVVMKSINGQQVQLGAAPFLAQDGVTYSLRFDVIEGQVLAKAWDATTQPEPANWMVRASTGGSAISGQPGLRTFLMPGSLVETTAFQVIINPTRVPVTPQHF